MNASSRLTKNKARLKRYDELAGQEFDTAEENLAIQIPVSTRLGTKVVEAHDLAKAFDERLLFDHVNFSLPLAELSASSEETEPEKRPYSK